MTTRTRCFCCGDQLNLGDMNAKAKRSFDRTKRPFSHLACDFCFEQYFRRDDDDSRVNEEKLWEFFLPKDDKALEYQLIPVNRKRNPRSLLGTDAFGEVWFLGVRIRRHDARGRR